MARTVERIEEDIAALEEALSALAAEISSAYTSYLNALGPAVRKHLILASYHLCTQGYAKSFLSLSLNQRQQLQQALRKLGQQASAQLLAYTRTEERGRVGEVGGSGEAGEAESNSSPPPVPHFSLSVASDACNPMDLAQWQQNLEQAIANTLKTVSRETNHLLQQVGILPNKLPGSLLEAAVNSSEASAEAIAGPPNLLNLLIETENSEESDDSNVTPIIAINLRLPEIEFADATVRAGRNQIRSFEVRLKSLGREYYKKQRERAVAEAEAAWRASWFEE